MASASTEIRAESLLKELAGVWKDLGKEQSEYAVVRSCSMTLLVATAGTGDEQEVAGTLGDLMYSHPGRYITLRLADSAEAEFSARVFAQCQLAFGRRQQLCCEQIEFTATRNRIPDFYAVALGLTVPDLPVLLWIKKAPLLLEPEFQPLLRLARSLLIDSAGFEDAVAGLTELEARQRDGWRVKDLNWSRLTIWRETIAGMFDNAAVREMAPRIERVEVIGRDKRMGTDVQYLAAWLALRLPAASVSAEGGAVERIRLTAGSVVMEVASLPAPSGITLTSTAPGIETLVHSGEAADAALLSEELGILGPDAVFAATLPEALRCARMNR